MYLFYVDESGNLDTKLKDDKGNPKDHIYVLAACGMWEGKWHSFYKELTKYKSGKIVALGKRGIRLELEDCEIKSSYLRAAAGRKRGKFIPHLNEDEINELKILYYSQLPKRNVQICAVVIDKRRLESHYDQTKLHRKAWELLCERIANNIRRFHSKHKVILIKDDISIQDNAALAKKHSWLLANRTTAGVDLRMMIEMPLFTRSELNEGLQLADLCAYNVYRAFKDENMEYEYFKQVLPFFRNPKDKAISGKIDCLKVFPDQSPLADMAQKITLCRQAQGG